MTKRPRRQNLLWAALALTVGCGAGSNETFEVARATTTLPAGQGMAVVYVVNVAASVTAPSITLTIDGKKIRDCDFPDCRYPPVYAGAEVALYIPNGGKYTLGVEGSDLALPLDLQPCTLTHAWIYRPHGQLQAQSWQVPSTTDAPAGMERQRMMQLLDPDKPVAIEQVAPDGTQSSLVSLTYAQPVWVDYLPGMRYVAPGNGTAILDFDTPLMLSAPPHKPVGLVFGTPGQGGGPIDPPGSWTFPSDECGYH